MNAENTFSNLIELLREAQKLGFPAEKVNIHVKEHEGVLHFLSGCHNLPQGLGLIITDLLSLEGTNAKVCSCVEWASIDSSASFGYIRRLEGAVGTIENLEELLKKTKPADMKDVESVEMFLDGYRLNPGPPSQVQKWLSERMPWIESSLQEVYQENQERLQRQLEESLFSVGNGFDVINLSENVTAKAYEIYQKAAEQALEVLRESPCRILMRAHRGYLDRTKFANRAGLLSRMLEKLYKDTNGFLVLPISSLSSLADVDYMIVEGPVEDATLEIMRTLLSDGGEFQYLEDAYEAAKQI